MSAPASPTRVNRNAVLASRRRVAQVGRHRQNRAGAGADAVDRGDDRLRALPHRLDEIAGHAREGEESGIFMRVSGSMISNTSPPEQKLPPAPARTIARTSEA